MSQNKPLTAKQEAFCLHYVANGFNATQAAISAGYSEDTANEQGARLLANVSIKERIAELGGKTVERAKASADDVFEFATNATFFDPADVFEVVGTNVTLKEGKKLSDIPKPIRQLIQAIKPKKTMYGPVVEIVFVDKMKAADMLARFHSMYKDQVTVKNTYENATDAELEAKLKEMEGK